MAKRLTMSNLENCERIALQALKEKGCTSLQIRERLNMSRTTYYRRLDEVRRSSQGKNR